MKENLHQGELKKKWKAFKPFGLIWGRIRKIAEFYKRKKSK